MNKIVKHIVIYCVVLVTAISSYSQDNEKVESSKLFLKTYFRLPNVTTNKFYKGVSRGISDVAISLNYDVYKGINVGAGFKHTFFEISQFKITENLDAQTHFYGPFVDLSYTYKLSASIFAEPSLQIGTNKMVTTSNPCRNAGITKHVTQTSFYSPNLNIYIKGFDRMAYSFSIGYTVTQSNFSPSTVCLTKFSGYSEPDYKDNINHINVGFGFLVYLGKLRYE